MIIGALLILIFTLGLFINKLRQRPRIKKRFIVSKNGITPLTTRPELPRDQCEIMIENCCNMNICETVSRFILYFMYFMNYISCYLFNYSLALNHRQEVIQKKVKKKKNIHF